MAKQNAQNVEEKLTYQKVPFLGNNGKMMIIGLLVILGIMLSYNFDVTSKYDLLFEADSPRVIGDMTNIYASHYRLKVHPLFVILTEPVFFILRGISINNIITLIILSSIISSLTIVFIYKILSL